MKRLVLVGEGEGERRALPIIAKRLISNVDATLWTSVILDEDPIIAADLPSLLKADAEKWRKWINAAKKRRDFGGILAVFDGDAKRRILKENFCAKVHASKLVSAAIQEGAGTTFSLAVVFACVEFESWLIAGAESLAGKGICNGLNGVREGTRPPDCNLEASPRDAKKWLNDSMTIGYKESRDQHELVRIVDIATIRSRGMRSFRRMDKAVTEVAESLRNEKWIASPR